jgi:hypothetical protein
VGKKSFDLGARNTVLRHLPWFPYRIPQSP